MRFRLRNAIGASWLFLVISRGSNFVAVPILLSAGGDDLYAAWVLASTLVMSQGLLDFGVAAALARFAAVAQTKGSRHTALVVLWRGAIFYLVLSLIIGVPCLVYRHELVGLVPYLQGDEARQATGLLGLTVIAFGLTNLVLVLDAVLRGLGRISLSYTVQAIGWAAFLPALLSFLGLNLGIQAAGWAWIVTYSIIGIGLSIGVIRALTALSAADDTPPSTREMAVVGGQWQVSSWADFATFQLPRIIGGIALTGTALVSIDLALRFSALIVAPLFAVYPVVLPLAASAWARGGREELAAMLTRPYLQGLPWFIVGVALLAPVAIPAVATWSGRQVTLTGAVITGVVLVGVSMHASTGLFSSALLASGELGLVVRYKAAQLGLAVPLVVLGTLTGPSGLGVAVLVALAAPALVFNRRARSLLQVPSEFEIGLRPVLVASVAASVAGFCFVAGATTFMSPWPLLVATLLLMAIAGLGVVHLTGLARTVRLRLAG